MNQSLIIEHCLNHLFQKKEEVQFSVKFPTQCSKRRKGWQHWSSGSPILLSVRFSIIEKVMVLLLLVAKLVSGLLVDWLIHYSSVKVPLILTPLLTPIQYRWSCCTLGGTYNFMYWQAWHVAPIPCENIPLGNDPYQLSLWRCWACIHRYEEFSIWIFYSNK